MKSPILYLAIMAVALVVLTTHWVHRKSLEDQIEEYNERFRSEKFLSNPTEPQTGLGNETFLQSLDPTPRFALVDKITLQLHEAAAREFFKIAGVTVDQINPGYFYELSSNSRGWVTLIGETAKGEHATLVVAAKVDSKESLIALIEKRWELPKEKWTKIENVSVKDCAHCDAYHFKFKKEDYIFILGRSEKSDVAHAVAELSQPSNLRAQAQKLADRISFQKSEDF